MKKTNRILSLILAIVMVVCMLPMSAFAAVDPNTNLCEHHTAHDTAVCGWVEGSPAVECTHGEHTDDCYEVKCSHVCDESCIQYSPCTFVCTGAEDCLTSTPTGEHDPSCYTLQCTHICGEDCADPCAFVCTGEGDCVTQVLNCQNTEVCYTTACNHVHDDTCREKLPCAFICTNEENCLAKTLICGHVEDGSCCAKTEVTAQPCTFVCETCANTPAPVAETYTITYDANGGTGTVTDSNAYAADENATVLAADGLTAPAGKEFDSWNTNADGTGISHTPGGSIAVTENITLYAQWVDKCTCNVHCTAELIKETSCAFCRASGNPDDCKGTDTLEGGEFTYQGIVYKITDKYNHDVSVKDGDGVSGNVVIPAKAFNGDVSYTVTEIMNAAFQSNSNLTSITIPDSVTKIGYVAFRYCSALTSITIPGSVTEIGSYAFYGCTILESVNLPYGLTTIGEATFHGCSGLKTVTIPSSVKTIGIMAFNGCSQLTNITIPQGVTTIANLAFEDCESLTSVTIPNSVTEIGAGVFIRCKKLSSVVLPSGLTGIPETMFGHCVALKSINIPDSVTSIGRAAFQGTALTSVTIPASVTTIEERAFWSCSSLQTVLLMTDSPKTIDATAFEDTSATITHKYAAPTNLHWDGTTLRWDALKTGYVRYKVDAKQLESPSGIVSKSQTYYVTGGSCDLSSYLSSGTYEIRLTAVEPEMLDNSQPSYESSDTITLELKYPHQVEISNIQQTRTGIDTASVSFNTSMAGTMYYTVTDMRYNTNPSISTDGEGTAVPQGYYEFDLSLVGGVEPTNPQYLYVTFKTANGVVSDVTRIDIDGYSGTTYKLTVTAGENGKIDPGSHYIEEGRSVTFTITPDSGYKLDTLTLDGEDVTSAVVDNQYTLTNVTAAHTIQVSFKLDDSVAPLSAPTNLTWDGTTAKWDAVENASGYSVQLYKDGVAQGDPVTTTETEYTFPISESGSYTFKVKAIGDGGSYSDSSEAEVGATAFYTVTFNMGGHGTAPASQTVEDGGKVTKPADPSAEEYTFGGWYADAACTDAWDFANDAVTANTTLYAKWTAVQKYQVYVSNDGGGTVTGEGSYAPGEQVTITATPDTANGYCTAGWGLSAVGGGVISPIEQKTTHTFIMPEKDVAISIAFVQHSYIAYSDLGNGTHQNKCIYCQIPNGSPEAHVDETGAGGSQEPNGICDRCDADLHIHSYDTLKYDADNHWYECSCGDKSDVTAHSGGTATCTEKAICSACSQPYGDFGEHNWDTNWTTNGEKHWHKCLNSGCTEVDGVNFHSGGTATCTGQALCEVCGVEYGTPNGNNHNFETVWTQGEDTHYHACSRCDVKKDEADHEYDDACDTACNICGKVRTITHTYAEAHDDAQHWQECSVCHDKKNIAAHAFDNDLDSTCNGCSFARTISYAITTGGGQTITKGNTATFASNAPFDKFVRVEVDGQTIGSDSYTAVSGSTKVTLKAAYIETLSAGEHTLTIVSTDGSASTTFTVKNKPAPVDPDVPQTGDTSHTGLWLIMMLVGGLGLAATIIYGKKRRTY